MSDNYKGFKFGELQDDNGSKALKFGSDELSSVENLLNACIMIDDSIVVIDVDKPEMVDKMKELINNNIISTTIIFKTNRGYHLYYKKPSLLSNIGKQVDIPLACGLRVDFLANNTNTKKITAKIKENGLLRNRVDNSGIYNKDDLPTLPEYFYPLIKSKDKVDNLIDLNEGDGRNNALFRHLGLIKNQYISFNDEIVDNIAMFINQNIFEKPLDDKELKNLVKSNIESSNGNSVSNKLKSDFAYRDEKGKLDMQTLVNDIILNYELISYADILYIKAKYTNDDYIRISTELEIGRFLKDAVILDENQANKLIFNLLIQAKEIDVNEGLPIRTKNNFEMKWDESNFVEKQSSNFTMFNLDINYNPNAYDETVDKFLNHIANNDEEVRTVIEEMLGHCLFTKHIPEFAYFIVSNAGETGKTTFLTMLETFIGSDLTTSLSLELMKEQHNIASMSGKLLNIGDDIDGTFLEVSNNFKTIVSGASITGRNLYERSKTYKIVSTLIFSANKMPRFKDVSGGIERRVIIIPCKNKVKDEDKDPTLQSKLASENAKSYLLNLAIKGRKRLMENKNKLSYSEVIERETNEYLNINNSMRSFVYHYDDDGLFLNLLLSRDEDGKYVCVNPRTLYKDYERICDDYGFNAFYYKTFTSTLKDVYDVGVSKKDNFIIFGLETIEENMEKIGAMWEDYVRKFRENKALKLKQREDRFKSKMLESLGDDNE